MTHANATAKLAVLRELSGAPALFVPSILWRWPWRQEFCCYWFPSP